MNTELRPMTEGHWTKVREIYLAGIAGGQATFETAAPSWEDWDASHLKFARIVAIVGDDLRGWAALAPVSRRAAYAGVAEVSVYVAPDFHGKGLGRTLLEVLIRESEEGGVWTLQASIFLENEPSIRLHRSCGFREVGWRERISTLNGVWRSTMLMERRSTIVGWDS
jgi:L-amino acid N-acyltransferase YncA